MTLIKNIGCLYCDSEKILENQKATIRFTSDRMGETLSIQCMDKMFLVNYKEIEKVVKKERKMGYKRKEHFIMDDDDAGIDQ